MRLIRGKPSATAVAIEPKPGRPAARPSGSRKSMPSRLVSMVNIALASIVIGELAALGLVAMAPERPTTLTLPPPKPDPSSAPTLDALPLLSAAVSRQVFVQPVTAPAPRETPAKPAGQAQAILSRLTLIGIVTGEPPQAIIEDAQTRKTYFATEGQAIVEGLTVKDVLENRVILEFNGETVQLSL